MRLAAVEVVDVSEPTTETVPIPAPASPPPPTSPPPLPPPTPPTVRTLPVSIVGGDGERVTAAVSLTSTGDDVVLVGAADVSELAKAGPTCTQSTTYTWTFVPSSSAARFVVGTGQTIALREALIDCVGCDVAWDDSDDSAIELRVDVANTDCADPLSGGDAVGVGAAAAPIVFVNSPAVALISGPTQVAASLGVVLDGSGSYDPDIGGGAAAFASLHPGARYLWFTPSHAATGCALLASGDFAPSGAQLSFAASAIDRAGIAFELAVIDEAQLAQLSAIAATPDCAAVGDDDLANCRWLYLYLGGTLDDVAALTSALGIACSAPHTVSPPPSYPSPTARAARRARTTCASSRAT